MFRKYGPFFILLGLVIILSFASENFLNLENLSTIAKQTAVIGVLTIGELLVIVTGGIDLALGGTLAFSTVISALLMKSGTPIILCFFIAIVLGAIVGFVNGILVTNLKIPPFIATLGTYGMLRGGALIITDGLPVSFLPKEISWLGNGTILHVPVSIIILAILAIAFQVMLSKTVFGRYVYALGSNLEATRLAGINVGGCTRKIYMFSGILSSIAGILLLGRLTSAQPTAATGYELNAIAASVIGGASMMGGVGTVWGAVVGAFIISTLSNGFTLLHVNVFFQQMATGLILILAVYIDTLQRNGVSMLKKAK